MSSVRAEALEQVFARWARRTRAPGVAWGLVRDGELAASGGVGTLTIGDGADDAVPDADSVFRIASMTKSFTGAALMTLVVDGRLRLDDPVTLHIPELEAWRGPTADGPPITIRHLVSMEAGLPEDDAWADRHVDATVDEMDALIQAGAMFAWTPGVRFEYSNLGWALLGRVIERVAGLRAQDLVESALLEPLALTATTWTRPSSRGGRTADPYRWQDGGWVREGDPLGDGAIAPMGGLWSTVRDLARWVRFFTDAWPPRDGADDGPLPRWARREMQQLRRLDEVSRVRPRPDGPAWVSVSGYGIGLGVSVDERLGTSIGHSGGLPGFGSHMRWLPDRGIGVIALSNVTYGTMHAACIEALEVLADQDALGPPRAVRAAQALRTAAGRAASLLTRWDDAAAEELFADNVGLDESYERRAAAAGDLVVRHGRIEVESHDAVSPLEEKFTAARGLVEVEIGLHHAGKVHRFDVTDRSVPSDDPILVDEDMLRTVSDTAMVVLRPVAELADAFERWQGEILDRLGGERAAVPAAHATVKAFGAPQVPLTAADEATIADVVTGWARDTPPVELRAEAIEVFEPDAVPVLRLEESDGFLLAVRELRARAGEAGLPPAHSDEIGVDDWIPHLSLAYPRNGHAFLREEFGAWTRAVAIGDAACLVAEAELVAYTGGTERRVGTFPLRGRNSGRSRPGQAKK